MKYFTHLKPHARLEAIAKAILVHLERMERDPKINKKRRADALNPFYVVNAYRVGNNVAVSYISFQGTSKLTLEEAERYLAALDAGKNITHHALRIELGERPR